jgi:hypothetical protein
MYSKVLGRPPRRRDKGTLETETIVTDADKVPRSSLKQGSLGLFSVYTVCTVRPMLNEKIR